MDTFEIKKTFYLKLRGETYYWHPIGTEFYLVGVIPYPTDAEETNSSLAQKIWSGKEDIKSLIIDGNYELLFVMQLGDKSQKFHLETNPDGQFFLNEKDFNNMRQNPFFRKPPTERRKF